MHVNNQYLDWLMAIVQLPYHSLLLEKLFNTEFVWLIPFDANRADDGIQLRYRFGRENDIPDPVVSTELDNRPCSILEMIVALAIRAEEQIMGDPSIGDRTSIWIHDMLSSLGVIDLSDYDYDEDAVNEAIYIFINRMYTRTGRGGLFEIPNLDPSRDMRTAEIWYQMCWYMNEH